MHNLPQQTEISFHIVQLIRELYGRINHCLLDSFSQPQHDLTTQQLLVFKLLAHHKKMTISELSRELALTKGTVSGIISRLSDQGLVQKHSDTVDQRLTWITFTHAGQQKALNMRHEMANAFQSLLGTADIADLETISEQLEHLLSIIKKENNT